MTSREQKVHIRVLDPDNEKVMWEVSVNEEEFNQCLKQKKKAGVADPIGSAMIDFALLDKCGGEE
jgi:hypothetical protein